MSARSPAAARLRAVLARVLEQPPATVAALPDTTPLFGAGLALDSLTGMELLAAIQQEFGVDVAAEDLNLDSLETLDTLETFIETHIPSG
jgi:acyl carrier protein